MAYIVITKEVAGVALQSVIYVDAVVSETHSRTARPTSHPIEDGTFISDHVIVDPVVLTMEARIDSVPLSRSLLESPMDEIGAVFSVNTPYTLRGSVRRQLHPPEMSGGFTPPYRANGAPGFQTPVFVAKAQWAATPDVSGGASFRVLGGSENAKFATNRVQEVYEALRDCVAKRKLVGVVTDIQSYNNLVITKLSAPREATDSLTFSLEFTGLSFAQTSEVELINLAKVVPAEERAKAEQKTVAGGKDLREVINGNGVSSAFSKVVEGAARTQ